jgi:hypothetical protein
MASRHSLPNPIVIAIDIDDEQVGFRRGRSFFEYRHNRLPINKRFDDAHRLVERWLSGGDDLVLVAFDPNPTPSL